MTAKQLAENLAGNAWRWDMPEFCRRAGLDPRADHSADLWRSFQRAAIDLGRLDARILELVCAPAGEEPR